MLVPILPLSPSLVLPQTLSNTPPDPFPKVLGPSFLLNPEQLGGLQIRRALVIQFAKQADDADQYGLGGLHRGPALRRALVAVLVLLGRVQDRDAQLARRVDVGVEGDGRLEDQLRREMRVLRGECQVGAKVGSYGQGREGSAAAMLYCVMRIRIFMVGQ